MLLAWLNAALFSRKVCVYYFFHLLPNFLKCYHEVGKNKYSLLVNEKL